MVSVLRPPLRYLRNGSWQIYGRTPTVPPQASFRASKLGGSTIYVPVDPVDDFVSDTTIAIGGSNCGVGTGPYVSTGRTNYTGDIDISSGIIQHMNITGTVNLSGTAKAINCYMPGRSGGSFYYSPLNFAGSSLGSASAEFCTIAPSYGTYYRNCVQGQNGDMRRCDIKYGVDLIHSSSGGLRVYDSHLHDMSFWYRDGIPPYTGGGDHPTDARKPGWTHNDILQALGGKNYELRGCHWDGKINKLYGNWAIQEADADWGTPNAPYDMEWSAGVTVTPTSSATSGKILYNYMDHFEIGVQIAAKGAGFDTGNDWDIGGNRVGIGHPYAQTTFGGRFEMIRATAGMGAFTNSVGVPNKYWGDSIDYLLSHNNGSGVPIANTATTSPLPLIGNDLAGGPLPTAFTTRIP